MGFSSFRTASWVVSASALSTILVAAACSAGADEPGPLGGGTGGSGNVSAVSGGSTASGGSTGSGGLLPGSGGLNIGAISSMGGGGSTGTGGGCSGVSQQAEKILGGKADIIWVLDNSGSMFDESVGIQNNMNFFSEFITTTGIDVHVVAISSGPPIGGLIPPYGICVAPPLGSGKACPDDTNPPLYTHILQEVSSWDALFQLMNTYPRWQSAIRPDSTKTIVVVTDDEAQPIPTPQEFKQFFDNAWQGSTWRFSGVFCKAAALNCFRPSVVYGDLVQQTAGVFADLGTQGMDWTVVFKQLADAVVADAKPVDCEWKIPPAPMGKTFEKDMVNVDFTPTSGVKETIFKVTKDTCQDPAGGWFYDNEDAPTTVVACPQSCAKIQADDNAKIDIAFGCETKRPIM